MAKFFKKRAINISKELQIELEIKLFEIVLKKVSFAQRLEMNKSEIETIFKANANETHKME